MIKFTRHGRSCCFVSLYTYLGKRGWQEGILQGKAFGNVPRSAFVCADKEEEHGSGNELVVVVGVHA